MRVIAKGGVWTNGEDEVLRASISKYGKNQWARISSLLVRKTAKQCKARWMEWLDPAIKKTEWAKDEDEKLLHLARLLPTQWRTIAPIVGRTANQCLERYQRLLDEAEQQESNELGLAGVGDAGPSADDVRRLRPGEVDPDPENRPARPDPIDMDEDEKEMLSEARARLANTQGKKAKRKARERMLEEARRLAILQKKRELKAAGILMRSKPKKGGMDYMAEIPFEKQPAPGFYDTTEENAKKYEAPIGKNLRQLHGGKRLQDIEEDERRKKQKQTKENKDAGAMSHFIPAKDNLIQQQKEAQQISKRRRLVLPGPQVGENELEEIVKIGQAGANARAMVDDNGNVSSQGLLGEYSALGQAKDARTPRTAPQHDNVMAEARNIRTLSMQQTPLLGEENTPLREIVGRAAGPEGSTPRSSIVATPNPLATPFRGGASEMGTPRSEISSSTPLRTPMRDSLNINGDFISNVGDTPRLERMRLSDLKSQLQQGFRSLPAAKNEFELVLPEDEQLDDEVSVAMRIEDATAREAKLKAILELEETKALARRSQAIKRGLPRPVEFDAALYLRNLALAKDEPSTDPARAEMERLVAIEMVRLLEHDSIVYPVAGGKRAGGGTSTLESLDDDALAAARLAVHSEIAQAVGLPGASEAQLKRAVMMDTEEFERVWRPTYDARAYHAPSRTYVDASTLDDAETIAGYSALIELNRERMTKVSSRAAKAEKKLGMTLGGYQARSKTLAAKLSESYEELSRTRIELHSFDRLATNEQGAVIRRMESLRDEVDKLERKHREGQGRFRELDDARQQLISRVEALELEEAESINEAALAAMEAQDVPLHLPPSPASSFTVADFKFPVNNAERSEGSSVGSTSSPASSDPVDVKGAEVAFEKLRRTLSTASSLHRTVTGQKDAEKSVGGEEGDFDLLTYLGGDVEAKQRSGFRSKKVGVVWEDLSVSGVGGMKLWIRVFPDAVQSAAMYPLSLLRSVARSVTGKIAPKPKTASAGKLLLHRFNGSAEPGEMVLVLGRPGSGCSTFLKNIANQRGGFLGVEGNVSYGGIDAATMGERFRGEVVYNQEDDVHHATLTVSQTLLFALDTKTPGKLLPNVTRADFRREILDLLLTMLNMKHTANTLVGSAAVRGVSGGERKRVSILEMMTSPSVVGAWDNASRGLDASTALDYARSLRIMTDLFESTNFVSLYQAGEGIYECFDKVLVIDQGRQVYYGPTSEARAYFTALGFVPNARQTTADYLTGCTDENERKVGTRADGKAVPLTPAELEEAYYASEIYQDVVKARETFKDAIKAESFRGEDFRQAVADQKRKGVSKNSIYTVSFYTQVRVLVVRQLQLKLQDRLGLIVSILTALTVSLIAGSVYFQLPDSAAGAFTRGGVIFISILFNSFQAFNELASQLVGKPIAWRQGGFAMYRPAALTLASTLADAPLNSAKILMFCIVIYFLTGLSQSAGAFFTFYIIVLAGFFSLAALFRLLGTLCSSFDIVARLAAIVITTLVLYSGYLVPVFSMKRWLFWIYYINPLNYAFSAAMMNEFERVTLQCDGAYITPRNVGNLTKYPLVLGANQVCTLRGSTPGIAAVPGRDYILANFEYNYLDKWRNFGICLVFFVGFNLLQAWAVEYLDTGANAPQITVFQKENVERTELNEKLQAGKEEARRGGDVDAPVAAFTDVRKPLTWESLCYTVPVPGGNLQLLDNVFGYVKPGTLTALMGASGAGKTTLLDVLASRKSVGVVSGDVLVDGKQLPVSFQRQTAYVEQQDTHEATATVREAFRFSAYLRQPASVSKADKDAYVEEVIQLLELEDLADSIIGFPGFGLGIEARKRVTIGVELASKPQLLLFLDEPTSGLDGQSAYNIVRFLRKLANAGQAILVTVHQPNALLFESFDRLLLLKKGGRTVYFGDIGIDSKVIRRYFESQGADCPADANPAEFMLEAIGAGSRRMIGKEDWADRWLDSREAAQVRIEIEGLKADALQHESDVDTTVQTEYATGFRAQMGIVGRRTHLALWRNPNYGFTRLFNHITIGLAVSLTFLQLGSSLADLQYRVFAIFFVVFLPAIIISQVEPSFIGARGIFFREQSSKMYSPTVFALAQLAAEVPYSFLCALIFYLLYYFPMGFNYSPSRAGYQYIMILVVEVYGVTLGQMIAALAPSVYIAAMVNPFLLVLFSLFCGVTVPAPSMPYFWRSWMYPLDPYTRIIAGMVSTELHQLPITCIARELVTFTPPSGQTCQQWAGEFVSLAGGYLVDPTSTTACDYCQYSLGDQFYDALGVSFDTRWRDLGILIAFGVFNGIVTVLASRYLNYSKR